MVSETGLSSANVSFFYKQLFHSTKTQICEYSRSKNSLVQLSATDLYLLSPKSSTYSRKRIQNSTHRTRMGEPRVFLSFENNIRNTRHNKHLPSRKSSHKHIHIQQQFSFIEKASPENRSKIFWGFLSPFVSLRRTHRQKQET